jgi:xanthine dehydrogenase accessory factor
MRSFFETTLELEQKAENFVVVTIVSGRGSIPQDPGAKAIITNNGLVFGTIGGGKVEARAMSDALLILNSPQAQPHLVTWNLQTDIGMTCGGEMTFLFELHQQNSWPIAVFGAGHVAQALIRTLARLPCQITCIDHRAEWIEKLPNLANLRKLCLAKPEELVKDLNPKSFFIVMTQGHARDLPILKEIFKIHPHANYVGGIGSDVKAQRLKKELLDFGISNKLVEKFICPIGLPIGKNHPAEIAISICAQLLQKRDSTF